MKIKLLILALVLGVTTAHAQSFFNNVPPLETKFGVAKNSVGLPLDSILNAIRPVVVVSATVSDGAQLAGGAGFGYQRLKWNATTQAWQTMWSVSAVGLLGTNGLKITGTGGIIIGIPGTNGRIGIGGGRDFTLNDWVLITSAVIQFN
jgi:hypothetical protein